MINSFLNLNSARKTYKKIQQLVFIASLALITNSCEDVECVEPYQFFEKTFEIYSNPSKVENLNLYGTYGNNPNTASQSSDWQETGLVSNGDKFVIKITGAWVAQNAEHFTEESLISLKSCPMCTRLETSSAEQFCNDSPPTETGNCFCQDQVEDQFLNSGNIGTISNPNFIGDFQYFKPHKIGQYELPTETECHSNDYNSVDLCSCKPMDSGAKLDDENFYHYSIFSYKKQLGNCNSLQLDQNNPNSRINCAYRQGRYGLISLWGESGFETPERVYDLFTLKKICRYSSQDLKINGNPVIDSKGNNIKDCVKDGVDGWDYFYESKDGKIFKKNSTTYHSAGEVVKLKMLDNYYNDNYGSYKITFLSGVNSNDDNGLIEKIVRGIEEFILGTYNPETGSRDKNGVVEFMYKSIVSNNYFIEAVKMALIMYVCFFGVGYMLGVVELKSKEILMRIIKFGLVITFTTYSGWSMYKIFVVDFFKDGLDSLVMMITNLFDNYMGGDTSILYHKQQGGVGYSSRFSYVDTIIRNLTSSAASKKIWGLFFMKGGSAFGLLYIIAIYALILYFIYVMTVVALTYIVNLIKLVFAISIGPIFISFSLFSKTEDMYKNWLGFIGARSLEVMILFIALYPFLIVINNTFLDMLSYRACVKDWVIGPGTATIISSEIDRSLFGWFSYFIKIAALTFLTSSIVSKSSDLSGQLINIGGVGNRDSDTKKAYGLGGFSMASSIAKTTASSAISALRSKYIAGVAAKALRSGVSGANQVIRRLGIGEFINRTLSKAPIIGGLMNYPGPRTAMRNYHIDNAINNARIEANSLGLKGADRDLKIREQALKNLQIYIRNNKNIAMALGLDIHNIEKRFEQKLAVEPMKQFINQRVQYLKANSNLIGKDLRKRIRQDASEWAKDNLAGDGAKIAEKYFAKNNPNSIRDYVRRKAEFRTSEAIEKFKDDREMQQKYLTELQKNEERIVHKTQGNEEIYKGMLGEFKKAYSNTKDTIAGIYKWRSQNLHQNPRSQRKRFLKKLGRFEENQEEITQTFRKSIINQLNQRDENNKIPGVFIERSAKKTTDLGREIQIPKSYDEILTQGKLVHERDSLYKKLDRDVDQKHISDLNERRKEIYKDLLKDTPSRWRDAESAKNARDDARKVSYEMAKEEFYKKGIDSLNDDNDHRTLFEKVAQIESLRDNKTTNINLVINSTEMDKRNKLAEIITERAKEVQEDIKKLNQDAEIEKLKELKSQQEILQKGLLAERMDEVVKQRFNEYLEANKSDAKIANKSTEQQISELNPEVKDPNAKQISELNEEQKIRAEQRRIDRFTRIRDMETAFNKLVDAKANYDDTKEAVNVSGANFGSFDENVSAETNDLRGAKLTSDLIGDGTSKDITTDDARKDQTHDFSGNVPKEKENQSPRTSSNPTTDDKKSDKRISDNFSDIRQVGLPQQNSNSQPVKQESGQPKKDKETTPVPINDNANPKKS